MTAQLPIELVCPSCRLPPAAWLIDNESGVCTNPACGQAHPRLVGTYVSVVVAESRDVLIASDEVVDFANASSVMAWLAELEPGSELWEEALRLGMYARLHYGTPNSVFEQLYGRFLAPLDGTIESAIDIGCGLGRFSLELAQALHCSVVGLDSWPLGLRFAEAAARSAELHVPVMAANNWLVAAPVRNLLPVGKDPVRWLCADVHNPPLPARAFDLVVACNLFDVVREPALALGQASALLRPGGMLLMAQPDAWGPAATPADRWFSSSSPEWEQLLEAHGFDTLDRADGFEWTLSRTERTHFTYVSHGRLAVLRRS